ncbi:MAG: hypothetical protein WCH98_23630 [Verrucomicrobiota bacterium]
MREFHGALGHFLFETGIDLGNLPLRLLMLGDIVEKRHEHPVGGAVLDAHLDI